MGKPFSITKKCWIYTEPKEDFVMAKIIETLKKHKSLTGTGLLRFIKCSRHSLTVNLWKLIAKRPQIVRVRQHGRNRIYSLTIKS